MNDNGHKNGTVSIVIPALNEREGIGRTIRTIPRSKLEAMGYKVQVLVVDNGSNDGTGEIARQAGADVIFEPKRGYGNAYKAGFAGATGDIIATSDADATYPVEDIPRLVKIIDEDKIDFITTNRFAMMKNGAMSFRNKVGNAVLSTTMMMLFGLNIKDSQSGMWVFRRNILDNLKLTSNTPLSQELKIEACHFAGCSWREVPIEYRHRVGRVKLGGWKVGFENLFQMFHKRFVR
ncbi:MAG: glycosyltransferase family 2 protein [Dehalococcoidales bacterium]|nr:glycosyltransferase family 2 protein [Dehalococcoidales bacterium]